MVIETFREVYGKEASDGYIRVVLKSLNLIPAFKTQHDFNVSVDK